MNETLSRALLLSSKREAETFVRESVGLLVGSRLRYKLLVKRLVRSDVYRLEIFRVTYPNQQQGKGWGDPHVAQTAHYQIEKDVAGIHDHLHAYHFSTEDGWEPCEDEEVSR